MELITRSLPNVEPSLHSWGKHTGSWCILLLIRCRLHPALHLECLLSYSHPSLLLALFPDRPLELSLTAGLRGHSLYLCAEHRAVSAATRLTSPPAGISKALSQCCPFRADPVLGAGQKPRTHPWHLPQEVLLSLPTNTPASCPPHSWSSHPRPTLPLLSHLPRPLGLPHLPVATSADSRPGLAGLPSVAPRIKTTCRVWPGGRPCLPPSCSLTCPHTRHVQAVPLPALGCPRWGGSPAPSASLA